MPVEVVSVMQASDGEAYGNGTYELLFEIDRRASGQEFILAAIVDGTKRQLPTHYEVVGAGLPAITGEVPAGVRRRFPDEQGGTFTGLRIDGGRPLTYQLW